MLVNEYASVFISADLRFYKKKKCIQAFYSFLSNSTRIIDSAQLSLSFNCFTERGVAPPLSGGDEVIGRENVNCKYSLEHVTSWVSRGEFRIKEYKHNRNPNL